MAAPCAAALAAPRPAPLVVPAPSLLPVSPIRPVLAPLPPLALRPASRPLRAPVATAAATAAAAGGVAVLPCVAAAGEGCPLLGRALLWAGASGTPSLLELWRRQSAELHLGPQILVPHLAVHRPRALRRGVQALPRLQPPLLQPLLGRRQHALPQRRPRWRAFGSHTLSLLLLLLLLDPVVMVVVVVTLLSLLELRPLIMVVVRSRLWRRPLRRRRRRPLRLRRLLLPVGQQREARVLPAGLRRTGRCQEGARPGSGLPPYLGRPRASRGRIHWRGRASGSGCLLYLARPDGGAVTRLAGRPGSFPAAPAAEAREASSSRQMAHVSPHHVSRMCNQSSLRHTFLRSCRSEWVET